VAANGHLVPQGGTTQDPQPRRADKPVVTRRPRQVHAGDRAGSAAALNRPDLVRRLIVAGSGPGGAAHTPVRFTRRGRLVVTAAAMLAIGAASIGVAGAAQATGHSGAPVGPSGALAKVQIKPGESLWSVAEAYDPNADTRVVIGEIVQMNSLTSVQVQPGQVIWVPRD
jgi:pimeloyl-ACP methyl ester carboxylesterase